MQGNNSLQAKTFKKFPKSPFLLADSHFLQAPNLQCELSNDFEWLLVELRVERAFDHICIEKARYKFLIIIINYCYALTP